MKELQIELSGNYLEEFKNYLYERENAEATIQKYITDVRTFVKYLDGRTEVDKAIILEYKNWLISRYAIRSVNSMLAALNQFFVFLEAPYLKVKRVRFQQNLFLTEEKELTRQEYQKLVAQAKKDKKEWLALVMETIASTGIRISELRYFTAKCVKQGRIEIYNKGKYRRIFIPKKLQNKLLVYVKQQNANKGPIFVTRTGKPRDRVMIWKEMKKLKDKTGISAGKIFPHNLRRLFARAYYQCTKDIFGLADLMGHSNVNLTRMYTANSGKIYRGQLDKMKVLEI